MTPLVQFTPVQNAIILFVGACLQSLILAGLFMLLTQRVRLYKNALVFGFLMNGIRAVGYLAPGLLLGFTPDMVGVYGNALMMGLVLISYFQQAGPGIVDARHQMRVIKYLLIGLALTLLLASGVGLLQSNRDLIGTVNRMLPEAKASRTIMRSIAADTTTISRLRATIDSQNVQLGRYRVQVAGLDKQISRLTAQLSNVVDLLTNLTRYVKILSANVDRSRLSIITPPLAKPKPTTGNVPRTPVYTPTDEQQPRRRTKPPRPGKNQTSYFDPDSLGADGYYVRRGERKP